MSLIFIFTRFLCTALRAAVLFNRVFHHFNPFNTIEWRVCLFCVFFVWVFYIEISHNLHWERFRVFFFFFVYILYNKKCPIVLLLLCFFVFFLFIHFGWVIDGPSLLISSPFYAMKRKKYSFSAQFEFKVTSVSNIIHYFHGVCVCVFVCLCIFVCFHVFLCIFMCFYVCVCVFLYGIHMSNAYKRFAPIILSISMLHHSSIPRLFPR